MEKETWGQFNETFTLVNYTCKSSIKLTLGRKAKLRSIFAEFQSQKDILLDCQGMLIVFKM